MRSTDVQQIYVCVRERMIEEEGNLMKFLFFLLVYASPFFLLPSKMHGYIFKINYCIHVHTTIITNANRYKFISTCFLANKC